ncbi:unnamed protein product [Chrysoparadoxa australica]
MKGRPVCGKGSRPYVKEACDAALRSRDGTLPAKPGKSAHQFDLHFISCVNPQQCLTIAITSLLTDKKQRRHQRSEVDKALGRIEWGLHKHKPYQLSEKKSKEGWVNYALAKKEQRVRGDQAILENKLVKASGDERKTLQAMDSKLGRHRAFQRATMKRQIKKLHITIRRGTQDEAGWSGLVVLGEPGRWDKHLCLKGLIGECERVSGS